MDALFTGQEMEFSSPGLVVCAENNANKPFNESAIKDEGSA
jgi:hypothetical protein